MTWTWKRLLSSYHHLFVFEDVCKSSRFCNTQKWTNLKIEHSCDHSGPIPGGRHLSPWRAALPQVLTIQLNKRLTLSFPAMRGSCEQTRWKALPRSNRSTRSTQSPWSRWTGKKSRWSRLVGTIIIITIIIFILLTIGWQDQRGTGWIAKFPFNCSSSTTRGLWGSTTLAKTASHILKVKLTPSQGQTRSLSVNKWTFAGKTARHPWVAQK